MKGVSVLVGMLGICVSQLLWGSPATPADLMSDAGIFRFPGNITAPDFELEDIRGNQVALKDFRGKLVLLDFWATW
jgi:cytochrome oxidase Cu insertion factor (SCO1/SenC/PrrC family)